MHNLPKAIVEQDLNDLLNELLFEDIPHVFKSSNERYRVWRARLSASLKVDPSEIVIVGSAAVGVSLNPTKNFKPFDEKSDVDVAVISDYFFSEAWHYLRSVDLALPMLTPAQRIAVVEHQKRYVYWGCIATDRLLPILPFGREWLEARAKLMEIEPTIDREINFRIYKDFRALRGYQTLGLKMLRDTLLNPEDKYGAELS